MAATALAVQVATPTGLLVTYSTPTQTTGHTAPTGQDVILIVKNASGGSINCDLHVPAAIPSPGGLGVPTPSAAAAPSRRVVCAVGDTQIPLDPAVYGDPAAGGLATFDLSAFASTTLACTRSGS
jgi:hypothetical protein